MNIYCKIGSLFSFVIACSTFASEQFQPAPDFYKAYWAYHLKAGPVIPIAQDRNTQLVAQRSSPTQNTPQEEVPNKEHEDALATKNSAPSEYNLWETGMPNLLNNGEASQTTREEAPQQEFEAKVNAANSSGNQKLAKVKRRNSFPQASSFAERNTQLAERITQLSQEKNNLTKQNAQLGVQIADLTQERNRYKDHTYSLDTYSKRVAQENKELKENNNKVCATAATIELIANDPISCIVM